MIKPLWTVPGVPGPVQSGPENLRSRVFCMINSGKNEVRKRARRSGQCVFFQTKRFISLAEPKRPGVDEAIVIVILDNYKPFTGLSSEASLEVELSALLLGAAKKHRRRTPKRSTPRLHQTSDPEDSLVPKLKFHCFVTTHVIAIIPKYPEHLENAVGTREGRDNTKSMFILNTCLDSGSSN